MRTAVDLYILYDRRPSILTSMIWLGMDVLALMFIGWCLAVIGEAEGERLVLRYRVVSHGGRSQMIYILTVEDVEPPRLRRLPWLLHTGSLMPAGWPLLRKLGYLLESRLHDRVDAHLAALRGRRLGRHVDTCGLCEPRVMGDGLGLAMASEARGSYWFPASPI